MTLNFEGLLGDLQKAEAFITNLKSHNATLLGQVAALTAELTATKGAQDVINAVQTRLQQATSVEATIGDLTTSVANEVATLQPATTGPAQVSI